MPSTVEASYTPYYPPSPHQDTFSTAPPLFVDAAPHSQTSFVASQQPGPKQKNGPGIASLVVGIVSFLLFLLALSVIPLFLLLAGSASIAGLALGITALTRKRHTKTPAVVGTILSGISLLLSVLLIVVGFAVSSTPTADEAESDSSAQEEPLTEDHPTAKDDNDETVPSEQEDKEPEAPPAEQGTRENPAPIGTTVEASYGSSPEWRVTIDSVTLDATDQVLDANMFNDAPDDGMQYAMISVTVTYLGDETAYPSVDLSFSYVSVDGKTYEEYDSLIVPPDPSFSDINEMYNGATESGNVAIAIPSNTAGQGTWCLDGLLLDKYFFAAE